MSNPKKPAAAAPSRTRSHELGMEELKALIGIVAKEPIQEFEFESGTLRFRIRKDGSTAVAAPAPALPMAPVPMATQVLPVAPAAAPAPEAEAGLHFITSPIVGTFYRSPNPNSPPFAQVGDFVKPGQTLCIVEAMKLMNEIESDVAGEIVKVLVENGQPVEYGERLYAVRIG